MESDTTNRSTNATRNIAAGLINKIITIILPFITRTVLIYTLGVEYLGLDSLYSSILQVLSLADLGFSSAVIYALYKPIADDDKSTIRAIMAYFKRVYRIIGAVILLVGIILIPFIPNLINGEVPVGANTYLLYFIYLLNTAISYLTLAYKQVLPTAMQRVDIVTNANTVSGVVKNVLQIAILLMIRNIYVYSLIIPACTVLNNLMMSIYVDKAYPEYKPKGELSSELRHSIRFKIAGLFISKVCQVTRNSFDSIFISSFLGLTATAMYSNYFLIMQGVLAVFGVVTTAVLPSIGNSIATETEQKNYSDMRTMNFLYMMLSGWIAICLLCLYQPFMRIWVGPELTFPDSTAILFVVYFYVLKMGDIRALYSDAAGLWWENRRRAIAEAVANVILNFLLVQSWGVNGVIFASLASLFVINFGFGSQIVFKYYFNNGKIREYFIDHAKYALCSTGVGTITYLICNAISNGGMVSFIFMLAICAFFPIVLYILIYWRSAIFRYSLPWVTSRTGLEEKLPQLRKIMNRYSNNQH